MKFNINKFRGISPQIRHSMLHLEVDVEMTKGQMFDAILEFQTKLTGAEWQEFLDLNKEEA